ncbi:BTAD domain-containing putative transcriptional regulator [Streptomyces sp. NBC_00096]|uniref:BTAD domain-containing putative transcriptional regulator n=1 Tax=Streptomyces sp. NBC_00096 TaxID=2975650 RepID=UPI00324EE665
MRYAILGTTQAVRADGTTVPIGGARLRALLTALALRPGRAVPAASLIDEVWDGDPPADGLAALQALVGRLRRALGRESVGSGEGGYVLLAARDDIDLYRFERLARAAAQASPAEAADLYDEALALWRGEPLCSLPGSGAEAARWQALRLDARRGRLDAALALGEAERVLPELTALCAGLPLDEPLQALRIRALRDAGRPAQALAAYEEVRRDLATRLGTTPGPTLRTLHAALLTPPDHPTPPPKPDPLPGTATPPLPGTATPPLPGGETPPLPGAAVPPPSGAVTPPVSGNAAAPLPGAATPSAWGTVTPSGPGVPAPQSPGTVTPPVQDAATPPVAGTANPPVPGAAAPPVPGGETVPVAAGTATPPLGTQAPTRAGGETPPLAGTVTPSFPGGGNPSRLGAVDPSVPGDENASAAGAAAPPVWGTVTPPFSAGSRTGADAAVGPELPGGGVPVPPGQGNLRVRLTTFVGREEDIRVIGTDLARSRLVTLLGPGGAGKTRLSQEAAEAHASADRPASGHPSSGHPAPGPVGWVDGVWFVELAPVDDPQDVAEAVLAALGARETKLRGASAEEMRALTERGGDRALDRLVEHCARRRMLLILDNCEHVVDAAARLAEEVLARCPGLQILATSREPLGVPGETLRPVDPLPDPVALRLLDDRGAAARAGFSVDEDPAAAIEICRRLDGMPLAIELAAARLRLLSPRQIADRLDDRFRLLTGGARTHLPRQQTLRAVVDWSWDLLDEPERAVLRRLSVFAGGCDLEAAEAVCADARAEAEARPDAPAGVDRLEVAGLLGSLVDKSLVVAAPDGPAGMRYRLLETVAEYATDRLAEAGRDRADTERRHLTHYRELARTTEPLLRGHGQRAAADLLATEYENLRTALRRAVADKDVGEVLCLVHSLVWYWHMHDLRAETRHWSGAAAALGPDPFAPPVVPAPPVYERIVDTPPPYGGELLTEAWRGIQMLCLASRDQTSDTWSTPEVRAQVDGMIAAYRPGLPQTCRTPSAMWIYAVMIAGDPELLKRVSESTVETARALGYRWELASALQLRANILANRADWAGNASRDAEESLAIYESLGDDWGCAEALSARAESLEKLGEYARAAEDYRAAIEHARRLGAKAQVTVLQVRMAGTLAEDGHLAEAEELLSGLLATLRQVGNEAVPAARMFLAGIYGRTGRIPEARAQLQSLRDEFSFGAYAVFDGFLLGTMAWLDNQEGKYEEALGLIRRAIEAVGEPLSMMIAPQLPAVYLMTGALSLVRLGGPDREHRAACLLGAYRALLPAGHFPVTTERADAELAERLARAALGGAAYEAAYAEGGGLTLEEATALV